MNTFVKGDLVNLNSGGPCMTLDDFSRRDDGIDDEKKSIKIEQIARNVILLCCFIGILIGCTSKETNDDLNNPAVADPEGTIALDMTKSTEKIDNAISVADGNFTGALFATLGKVQGLSAVTSIPKTGWVNKLAVVEGHGYIAYSPSKKTYCRMYVSTYDVLVGRVIVKFQRPFIGSEKEIKPQSATITLNGTESQNIEFTNASLFPFSWSFEGGDWCNASYNRPDETTPYNSIKINAKTNNPDFTPRECSLVLKSDIGKEIKLKIVQAGGTGNISVSTNQIYFSSTNTQTVQVTSNTEWTASSNAAWCNISPASGNKNSTITISATANTAVIQRNAIVTLTTKDNKAKAEITIIQPASAIDISTSNISFAALASQNTFTVYSNSTWTASSNQTWCTVTNQNNMITVAVTENLSGADRTAMVTVAVTPELKATVNIIQAKSTLALSKSTISFTALASSNTFTVYTNASTWNVNSNQSWCTATKSGNTVNVTVTENISGANRTAEISVTLPDNQKATITVTQAKHTLTLYTSTISFTAVAAQNTFSVTTNASSWDVNSNQSWCTATKSGNTVTVAIAENQSAVDRTANVTVTLPGNQTAIVNITQAKPTLTLSKTEINFAKTPANSETFTVTSNVSSWTTVSSNQSWCTVSKNGNTVTVSATQNTTGSLRQATVTVLYQTVTITQDGYQVGDYYNVGGVRGVVFQITGRHGKIVSMNETTAQWSIGTTTTGATSSTDGMANMNKIKTFANWTTVFPAFAWCDAKNTGSITGWYLPVRDELRIILDHITVINITMQQYYGSNFNNSSPYYWSSQEANSSYAYTSYFYINTSYSAAEKNSVCKVRAVKAF
ncbi:MAG: hypothetical protein LBU62_07075 [Bacteroidales bacterium]|jgi:hypothetical protein|nr:hypothetical protein [Bacteroidales bacterium]